MGKGTNPSICFIAGTLGLGGAERQLYYILGALKKLSIRTCVISLTRDEYWEESIKDLGIPIHRVNRTTLPLTRLLHIMSIVRQNRPYILQSQHFYTNLYVAIAGRLLDIYDIGAIRGNLVNEIKDTGRLGNLSLKMPRLLVANSYNALQVAETLGIPANRLSFLPNVVDCDLFYPMLNKKSANVIRLLTVGRLVPLKRTELFLKLIAQLKALSHPNQTIVGMIVGDGPQRVELEKTAYSLGLMPDNVIFLGNITPVADIYRQADIFISTSAWEGTPNVIMEAMASGLPVVASPVGDTNRLIAYGKTGYFIDSQNLDSTVQILITLIHELDLRQAIGMQAREHMVEHYSLKRLPYILQSFYQLLL